MWKHLPENEGRRESAVTCKQGPRETPAAEQAVNVAHQAWNDAGLARWNEGTPDEDGVAWDSGWESWSALGHRGEEELLALALAGGSTEEIIALRQQLRAAYDLEG